MSVTNVLSQLGQMENRYLDDRCDELNKEPWQLHEGWVEGVKIVHDQTLDVRAIVVLVSHDHQVTVPQLLHVCVHLQQGSSMPLVYALA